jgi:translation elongation factor EF-1alpha
MKDIGKVTHYYGKLGVAIVELKGALAVGDRVHIQGGTHDFDQTVSEMQVDHHTVEKAKKGDVIGLKVNEKAPVGSTVQRLEEGE